MSRISTSISVIELCLYLVVVDVTDLCRHFILGIFSVSVCVRVRVLVCVCVCVCVYAHACMFYVCVCLCE